MIYIEGCLEYCDISVKYPITDEDVNILTSMDFGNFIKAGNVLDVSIDCDDGISLKEFINTKLNPEQQNRVMKYIHEELEKLNSVWP